jgi:CheY-like chemotaxis protein
LKTIKKLGFPVKAVWNGKEALDYLQNPSNDQPRPDVILMDVQMPVLDGYRATYTIRNGRPFVDDPEVSHTPIVAMTASAIQGDREKCEMAGMDDYLAKPVKKPNLEKMLIKWAIEGRKKKALLQKDPKKKRPEASRTTSTFSETPVQSPTEQLNSELDRLEFAHRAAFERSSDTAGDAAIKQQQAEEKAITLRDDALMESGDDPRTHLGRGASDESYHHLDGDHIVSDALTKENMQRFTGIEETADAKRGSSGLDDLESVGATFGDTGSLSVSISRASTGQNTLSSRKPG